jgi:hypothetical protein
MNKKLMLLAAGALSALAFAALPAVASAGEFNVDCTTCSGTISSTAEATLTTDSGSIAEKIKCTGATSGTATQTNGTSTGTVQIVFTGCKDEFISSQCNSTGISGEIKTNVMTSHMVRIDPISGATPTGTPGVLLTGSNVTFTCPVVGVTKTVTGNIIGHWTNPECGKSVASHTVTFGAEGNNQKYRQVTTTGTVFNLTSGSQASDATASAQIGSGAVAMTSTFTC